MAWRSSLRSGTNECGWVGQRCDDHIVRHVCQHIVTIDTENTIFKDRFCAPWGCGVTTSTSAAVKTHRPPSPSTSPSTWEDDPVVDVEWKGSGRRKKDGGLEHGDQSRCAGVCDLYIILVSKWTYIVYYFYKLASVTVHLAFIYKKWETMWEDRGLRRSLEGVRRIWYDMWWKLVPRWLIDWL